MAEEEKKTGEKKTLSLSSKKLELKKTVDAGQIRQSFSHGRTKAVEFEVKKKRALDKSSLAKEREKRLETETQDKTGLSKKELEERMRVLQAAEVKDDAREEERRRLEEADKKRAEDLTARQEEQRREAEEQAKKEAEEAKAKAEAEAAAAAEAEIAAQQAQQAQAKAEASGSSSKGSMMEGAKIKSASKKDADSSSEQSKKQARKTLSLGKSKHKQTVYSVEDALEGEEERQRSISSLKRAREKEKKREMQEEGASDKPIVREVVVPEFITVQELANRMAVRSGDLVKKLMEMGVMATVNQTIDADTAELVIGEFGHTIQRVSDADVEEGLIAEEDPKELQKPRAPVVTVMGHVDHGKTSLLDTIRKTDVVAGESGGITQHIGAYQVGMKSGQKITFIDTPGHAAFSEMRARGADVTDIVILVVAADDGIKEQTVEAINHAKAAEVPIIVAINKMDKPEANPDRVRNELLGHELVVEQMGGDIQSIEVSAMQGTNIDKLEEAILLQAEMLELKANPNRSAIGAVVESRIEKGRGAVATVLVQRGTLKVGDIFVAGAEEGKVRALINDRGQQIKEAGPSVPVEVLGFSGAPIPGDAFVVVEDEARAREVAEYRAHVEKERKAAAIRKASMDLLMQGASETDKKTLSLIIKSDVQGSVEALIGSFDKIPDDEVVIRVLHTGVGGINESDIALAQTSNALIIGFNVRANPQARDLAAKEGVEIRYYSIIYDVIDDVKTIVSGLLTPEKRENFLGYAEIREVFNITKVGKVAGCYITSGEVKRGAKVRLLRDNVVIHEGSLKTLKRFKDEVKEVKEGYECGMAFENYSDIRAKDVIECFEVQEIARSID